MGKEQTEILIQREPWRKAKEYTKPTDSSLERINQFLLKHQPQITVCEVLDCSVYITFKINFLT